MRQAVLLAIAVLSIFTSSFAEEEGFPKDCAIQARVYQLLHCSGCWTRLIRIEYGTETEGHCVCIYAMANNDLWVYDRNVGSRKLETKSRTLVELTKSLLEFYDKIRSSRFMDDQ